MTEDDTFRVLSRIPLKEVLELYKDWTLNWPDRGLPSDSEVDEFFKTHGWSFLEVIKQIRFKV